MAEAAEPSSMETTHIRSARWVIAWDETTNDHCYLQDADVVFSGSEIVHVGSGYVGPTADHVIDGSRLLVMPGLISTHTHLNSGPLATGMLEEATDPMFGHSPMYTRKGPFWVSDVNLPGTHDGRYFTAAMHHGLGELLASGVTTVVDIQGARADDEVWLQAHVDSGIRSYLAPCFQEAQWLAVEGRRLEYQWDVPAGRATFDQACTTLDLIDAYGTDRIRGMVFPAQVDTVSEGLMRESRDEARARGLVWQTHCSQSVPEFRAMIDRTGRTPVQWLAELGALDQTAMLGHAIYLDHHSALAWHSRDDLAVLAETGVAVAHCPLTFSRWGTAMESFGSYRDAGVRLALGNDTGPHNMLEEMRCAFTQARVASPSPARTSLSDIFRAATVGGADALGRSDIGRLAPGTKADLVLVDLDQPSMQPAIDPLRSLVFVAADRAVRDVYIDGNKVYSDRIVAGFDSSAATAQLTEALAMMIDQVDASDATPPIEEIAMASFPVR